MASCYWKMRQGVVKQHEFSLSIYTTSKVMHLLPTTTSACMVFHRLIVYHQYLYNKIGLREVPTILNSSLRNNTPQIAVTLPVRPVVEADQTATTLLVKPDVVVGPTRRAMLTRL
uniref:Uncharacterized protein n=1 Tax=Oryza punctata TaxID=4537 RepID=A0A0E0LBH7_ORYPU